MTDITMLIMICSRRMFLASCSFSVRCAENSARSRVLIMPPGLVKTTATMLLHLHSDAQPSTGRCAHPNGLFCGHLDAERNLSGCQDFGYSRNPSYNQDGCQAGS